MKHAKTLFKALMYAAVLASCVYFVLAIKTHVANLPPIAFNVQTLAVTVLSTVAVVVTHFLGTHVWRLLMSDQGYRVPMRLAVQVFFISQLGKYLPGNVGQFLGRGVLAKSTGIPVGVAVGTAVFEGIWNLVISLSLALLSTWVLWDLVTVHSVNPRFGQQAGWLLLLALVLPWLSIKVLNAVLPQLSRKVGGGQLLRPPRLKTSLLVSLLILVNFMLLGYVLKLQSEVFFSTPPVEWLSITLLFSSAWVAGYVVPGAPGGLGVREAMMVVLLTPLTGAPVATGLAVSMRLTSLLGDGLTVLVGVLGRYMRGQAEVSRLT
ncbi:flippase-like domain-containing protein [Hydrogenophaga taeniospiralis]|uniref:lysylphosphatidylglycerol synthase domain-containing protein n=1 Tax=Hydrogenophaga taeniospiralis TaxID=65656 RepID=UPI001CFAEFD1|nr:lysylphosphatidylglycerol synthase domain-containing protein [Hydrogenophaga taeniospiralis]MCB4363549.1 flippase-like domain-containing protein [Hydrogenophaga taeniospiralis]